MKTLADLKRRLAIGTRLRCIENTYRPGLNNTERVVLKLQTNGFWWTEDGATRRSWTDYPEASFCTWIDKDIVQLGLDPKRPEYYVRLEFLSSPLSYTA